MQKIWTRPDVEKIYHQAFANLMFQAQTVHRQYHDPNQVQISTLLSIKTGGCPENCAYCPQSAHYNTGLQREAMMPLDEVINAAKKAKENGASRFCMGAAWRSPPKKDLPKVIEMVKAVKKLGLESCVTLGMLNKQQAQELKDGGVDYVNHNLDTSEEHYKKIISTRGYQDRLDTLENVRETGMKVCCGGILGMGETIKDRFDLLIQLANMEPYPESVPINQLIAVSGTPLEKQKNVDEFEFIRVIATARIMMPKTMVRLSAGRNNMSATMQSLCFLAGANSIHYGEKLLTTDLPAPENDLKLMKVLGINASEPRASATELRTASISDRQ